MAEYKQDFTVTTERISAAAKHNNKTTNARIPPLPFLSAFGKSKLSSPEYGLK
jgi:hypothetical protein